MAADFPAQDEGVQVSHSRCVECGADAIVTMHDPDLFGATPYYQPLLIPVEDVCDDCIGREWARITAGPDYPEQLEQMDTDA